MPPPPPPPPRAVATDYHFHAYDYNNSAANGPWGLSLAQNSRGGYRFYSMRRDLTGLRDYGVHRGIPGVALAPVGGQTAGHRQTLMLSMGNQGAVAGRPTVVITGGIHAREWIAAEMAYLIAEYLIKNYPVGAGPFTPAQVQIRNLVNSRNIRIIPMVNPDGNDRTVFGTQANARFWRKNLRSLPYWGKGWVDALAPGNNPNPPLTNVQYVTRPFTAQYDVTDWDPGNGVPFGAWAGIPAGAANPRTHPLPNFEDGVDLNRNMPTIGWGYDCAPYNMWNPARDAFFGYDRGSEPETGNLMQAMVAAAAVGPGGHIDISIDYHCYGMKILYPSEMNPATLPPLHQQTGTMLQALIQNHGGGGGYQLDFPLNAIGYTATGSVMDHAGQQHQARSFTIELDPDLDGTLSDAQQKARFNNNENQIQAIFEKNIRGALAAIAVPATGVDAANFAAATWAWNVQNLGNALP
ncbi:MAG TPA: M14 family zinc carboxypeptidase [Trebonia sp.]|nr:M14 family zinc carboxypeptidase [Trebonia sp.]